MTNKNNYLKNKKNQRKEKPATKKDIEKLGVWLKRHGFKLDNKLKGEN